MSQGNSNQAAVVQPVLDWAVSFVGACVAWAVVVLAIILCAVSLCSCSNRNGTITGLKSFIAVTDLEVAAKKAELANEKDKFANLSAERDAFEAELKKERSKVDELATKVSESNEKVTDAERRLNAKTTEAATAKAEVSILKDEILRLVKSEAGMAGELKAVNEGRVKLEADAKAQTEELKKVQGELLELQKEVEAKAKAAEDERLAKEALKNGVAAYRRWASGDDAMKAALVRLVQTRSADESLLAKTMPALMGLLNDSTPTIVWLTQDAISKLPPKAVKYVAKEVGGSSYDQKRNPAQRPVIVMGSLAIPELLKVAQEADEAGNGYLKSWSVLCMAYICHAKADNGRVCLTNVKDDRDSPLSSYAAAALEMEKWITIQENAEREKAKSSAKAEPKAPATTPVVVTPVPQQIILQNPVFNLPPPDMSKAVVNVAAPNVNFAAPSVPVVTTDRCGNQKVTFEKPKK